MADYDVFQLTEGEYHDDLYNPLNAKPTISDDGRRVAFSSTIEPGRPGYAIWLYDRDDGPDPRRLSVRVDGDDRVLSAYRSQISGDGQKIVFAAPFYYTEEDRTGIYVYDIEAGTIRRVVDDMIPRWPSGAPRMGEIGMHKYVASHPSISSNGRWLAYVWTHYEGGTSTMDGWSPRDERLILADIAGVTPRGGDILEIPLTNVFGEGFRSLRMSGDGHTIAFYAGGAIEGLEVENVGMPPYETVTHGEHVGPTCDVYCYVLRISASSSYILHAVPDLDVPTQPLVVAHPYASSVQSFRMSTVLGNPPSPSADGVRTALNAGFVMGNANTGIYLYDAGVGTTTPIITFGARPGDDFEEAPLRTGAVPALSSDGRSLAYYRRDVVFPWGYGDPEGYLDGEVYCPCVDRDEVVVHEISSGEVSPLIETVADPICPVYTPSMGLGLAEEGAYVALVSRANKAARNADLSHEVYYATLVEESGTLGEAKRWMRLRATALSYLLVILAIAAAIVALLRVGVTLVVGTLVTSVATAYLLARRSPAALAAAAAIGGAVGLAGMFLFGQAEPRSIVAGLLVCVAFLLLALLFTPWRSVRRWLRRTRK